jgi:hypothetical protein
MSRFKTGIFADPYAVQSRLGTVPLPSAAELGLESQSEGSDEGSIDYNGETSYGVLNNSQHKVLPLVCCIFFKIDWWPAQFHVDELDESDEDGINEDEDHPYRDTLDEESHNLDDDAENADDKVILNTAINKSLLGARKDEPGSAQKRHEARKKEENICVRRLTLMIY